MQVFQPTDSTPTPAPNLIAAIHIGAGSVSMLVSEKVDDDGNVQPVDFFEQPVPIARDIFRSGRVGRPVIERIVRILKEFREALAELAIPDGLPNRVVATNILAEASNLDVLLNRIQIAAGLTVVPLDDGEMTRLIYMQSRALMGTVKKFAAKNTLVLHVGPGNTRVLYFAKGTITQYSSYRLGAFRAYEAIQGSDASGRSLISMLREQTRSSVDSIYYDYRNHPVDQVVAIGHEMQMIASHIGDTTVKGVTTTQMRAFLERVAEMSSDQRVREFQLDYAHADSMVAAIKINTRLAESFGAKRVFIPSEDYETEILSHLPYSAQLTRKFRDEVLQSATGIARQYKIDPNHAQQVERLSTSLFDTLEHLHQLGSRERLLLSAAAILHETGNFITPRAHHKHSYYIIRHSEIFGLSAADTEIVALIARYHRHSPPKPTHQGYSELSREDRMIVSKLAAILRVADALDRAHAQRVQDVNIRLSDSRLHIGIEDIGDVAVEQLAMTSKADMFQNIYGLEVVLESSRSSQ
ncbi:HD domain-containing protein [Sulfuriroseicoccus oceanibius]|uniref:HD domain-containing protein n=1 Tax=Sulfuriroseicoccus oceanibius TaxID=2707525 RepID=A0A6B3L6C4_9BACT|nr:HD domain-containing protein [Sulfuriroseicoccus oceanibius]QQL46149.1 HD domain-containing protein [Sulfuriroseicoccus oceanibius]